MTNDLIQLLEQATPELEKSASEMRTAIQTLLIIIRHPVGIMREISRDDFPDAAAVKKSLSALHAALQHAQEVVMKLIDRVQAQTGLSRLLIDEVQSDE